ncbi:hypothetical protein HW555_009683 [Spodoptera exigua]|uniref:C2H2-type domain-containing protein n=1 Tax=Spodoptera exigua TaxID=7107 RepID=A0A835L288_SPOEX|nr:hypothetical protein HW555_009683 [Spodoptera exigua]
MSRRFLKESRLREHTLAVHLKATPLACDQPGCTFTKKSLEGHLRSHSGERPFACTTCGATFGYEAALYNHTRLVHLKHKVTLLARTGDAVIRVLSCEIKNQICPPSWVAGAAFRRRRRHLAATRDYLQQQQTRDSSGAAGAMFSRATRSVVAESDVRNDITLIDTTVEPFESIEGISLSEKNLQTTSLPRSLL